MTASAGASSRHVDAVVVPGRIGDEAHARVGPLDDALLGILHREGHRVDDAALGQLERGHPSVVSRSRPRTREPAQAIR